MLFGLELINPRTHKNEGQDSFVQLQNSSTLVVVVKTDGSIKEITENKTPNIKNDGK